MFSAFFTGFFLGLSLIFAIGAQNAFVLRQGMIKEYVFFVALFCSISDAVLIVIGIASISFLLNNFADNFSNFLYGLSSLWLLGYGIIRLKNVFKSNTGIKVQSTSTKRILPTLTSLFILTFANPHVYLDTVILIGSISQQFSGLFKISFAIGAIVSSFVFFFSLAYGAQLLTPIMKNPISWKIFDSSIALIMFSISYKLATLAGWI